jgi:hypothetical protein
LCEAYQRFLDVFGGHEERESVVHLNDVVAHAKVSPLRRTASRDRWDFWKKFLNSYLWYEHDLMWETILSYFWLGVLEVWDALDVLV